MLFHSALHSPSHLIVRVPTIILEFLDLSSVVNQNQFSTIIYQKNKILGVTEEDHHLRILFQRKMFNKTYQRLSQRTMTTLVKLSKKILRKSQNKEKVVLILTHSNFHKILLVRYQSIQILKINYHPII